MESHWKQRMRMAGLVVIAGVVVIAVVRRSAPPPTTVREGEPRASPAASGALSPRPGPASLPGTTSSEADPVVRVHVLDPRGRPLASVRAVVRSEGGDTDEQTVELVAERNAPAWLSAPVRLTGPCRVEVTKSNYLPRTVAIDISRDSKTEQLEVVLTRDMPAFANCVFGVVVTSEGRLVSGAHLALTTSRRRIDFDATDLGDFEQWLDAGETAQQVVARPPTRNSDLLEARVDDPRPGRFLRFVMAPVELQPVDLDLDASDLVARLERPSEPLRYSLLRPDSTTVQTATQGGAAVRFSGVRPGDYRVVAHRAAGGLVGFGHIRVGGTSPARLSIRAENMARVDGRVEGSLIAPGSFVRLLPSALALAARRGDFDDLLPAVLAVHRFFYLDDSKEDAPISADGSFTATVAPGEYTAQVISAAGVPVTRARTSTIGVPATDLAIFAGPSSPTTLVVRAVAPMDPPEPQLVVYAPEGVLLGPVERSGDGEFVVETVVPGSYQVVLVRSAGPTTVIAGPVVRVEVAERAGRTRVVVPYESR